MESRSLRMVVNIVCPWRKESRRNVKSHASTNSQSPRFNSESESLADVEMAKRSGNFARYSQKEKEKRNSEIIAPKREKVTFALERATVL